MKQNSSYKKLKCLFKGYAGKVYLVELSSENDQPNKPKERVVLKRYYKNPNDPQEVTNLNEYVMLQKLSHPNIIQLQSATTETYQYKKYLCLSFDHMAPLNEMIPFLKHSHLYVFKQICLGVEYLHDNSILHRDIKPSNIFGTLEGKIKIGDFGISTYKKQQMTASTCTKNYRAPELFFGQREYDGSIDIWALGCTLVEMYTKKILFDGRSEIEIMTQITEQLGSLDEINWPGVSQLPTYLQFVNEGKPKLMETISQLPTPTQQLVIGMLNLNPQQRPNIKQILQCLENIDECRGEIAEVSYNGRNNSESEYQIYLMNQNYHIEFKTPQKPEKSARSNHSHKYSTPLIESLVFQTERTSQTLTNRGEQVLKRWDFFSDPFSVPDKYAKNSPLHMKSESSIIGNDSIDSLIQQKYFQKPMKEFQPIQKSQSEQNIMNPRQVKFAENVSVRNVEGEIFQKPMKVNTQFCKKSRFSKIKQVVEDSEASYK